MGRLTPAGLLLGVAAFLLPCWPAAGQASSLPDSARADLPHSPKASPDTAVTRPAATSTVAAYPATAALPAQEAQALVDSVVVALGGEGFLALRSQFTQAFGTMSVPGMSEMNVETIHIYELLPDRNRMELSLGFGPVVQGFDGDIGWMVVGGRLEDISDEQREQSRYGTRLLRTFDPATFTATLLPPVTRLDEQLLQLELTDASGYTTLFFIHPETYLLHGIGYDLEGVPRREWFSAYQPVDGLMVPFYVEIEQAGETVFTMTVEDVTINPDLDPRLFSLPHGGN